MKNIELTFKPFASKGETNLTGKRSRIELQPKLFYSYDCYGVDSFDDETGLPKSAFVDCIVTVPKDKIHTLNYYFDNKEESYFLQLNENCYGFSNKEEGKRIFDAIFNWLYEALGNRD